MLFSRLSFLFLACKYCISLPMFCFHKLSCFSKLVLANSRAFWSSAIWLEAVAPSKVAMICPFETIWPSFTKTRVIVPPISAATSTFLSLSTKPWILKGFLNSPLVTDSIFTANPSSSFFAVSNNSISFSSFSIAVFKWLNSFFFSASSFFFDSNWSPFPQEKIERANSAMSKFFIVLLLALF